MHEGRGVRPVEAAALVGLAAIWGASFLFIKIALRDVGALVIVTTRSALGCFAVAAWLLARRGPAGVRAMISGVRPLEVVVLSTLAAAVPFTLISWAETRIASGVAGLLNGSLPLVTAVLATRLDPVGRVRGRRATGFLLGFVGVGVIAGSNLSGAPLGVAAMLGAVVCYAFAAFYARRLVEVEPSAVALLQSGVAAVLVLPFALALDPPSQVPSGDAVLALLALGVGGTGIAWYLYYWLLASTGPQVAVTVTYLAPLAAITYGAVFLDERLTAAIVVGAGLVLAGEIVLTAPPWHVLRRRTVARRR